MPAGGAIGVDKVHVAARHRDSLFNDRSAEAADDVENNVTLVLELLGEVLLLVIDEDVRAIALAGIELRLFAIQVAKALGATVAVTAGSQEKLDTRVELLFCTTLEADGDQVTVGG